jgi:hypothetical protein
VNKITVGQCTITPWTEGTDTPVTVLPGNYTKDAYEAVDLGLSVKWASFNVGATKPEESGDYFAWGETEPKSDYSSGTYKYYDFSAEQWMDIGNNISGTQYDVAHVTWGGNWRMPTKDELTELHDSCTWTWTTVNTINGYQVTSKKAGYTDKSIFLPAAGYRGGLIVRDNGTIGYVWSGTVCSDNNDTAWFLYSYYGIVYMNYGLSRFVGLPVRPVTN